MFRKEWSHGTCGCEARREALNEYIPFDRKKIMDNWRSFKKNFLSIVKRILISLGIVSVSVPRRPRLKTLTAIMEEQFMASKWFIVYSGKLAPAVDEDVRNGGIRRITHVSTINGETKTEVHDFAGMTEGFSIRAEKGSVNRLTLVDIDDDGNESDPVPYTIIDENGNETTEFMAIDTIRPKTPEFVALSLTPTEEVEEVIEEEAVAEEAVSEESTTEETVSEAVAEETAAEEASPEVTEQTSDETVIEDGTQSPESAGTTEENAGETAPEGDAGTEEQPTE
jgi:hypothetical protein